MSSDITRLRLALIANGYHPIPNRDRSTFLTTWNQRDYAAHPVLFDPKYKSTDDAVASWIRRRPEWEATGLRIDGDLRVIDADIVHSVLADIAYGIICDVAPDIADRAPMRYGASETKFALFVRSGGDSAEVSRIHSRKYLAEAEDKAAKHSMIEIFTGRPTSSGNCSRQMGVYGPHSHNDDGTVAALYRWSPERPALVDTRPSDLPVLTIAQAMEIVDRFDAAAEAAGFVRKEDKSADIPPGGAAYDITPETRFDTNRGGVQLTYEELCEEYETYGDSLRCSSSFMPGRGLTPKAGWLERCSVLGGSNRHGCVAVFVHGDEVTHFPAELEPGRDQKILDETSMLPIAELAPTEPLEPAPDTDLYDRAAWLVETRAYYEEGDRVVRIYADTMDCQSTPTAFHRRYRYMHRGDPAKPHKKPVFATDLWEMTPNRRNIAGVRMAPNRPFPLYEEAGQLLKNTYRRPVHEGYDRPLEQAGLIAPFVEFMERFVPDPAERSWLLDWMAHKWAQPAVPGTSIFFVADDEESVNKGTFGTGRGTMGRIVRKLYGEQYCRAQQFSILDGSNPQSAYNDWLHGSILVTVDEAKTSKTAHRRGERNAAFEVLKDIVDPGPKQHRFNGKNRQAFDGISYCSIWVFTNHGDALSIPEHDRRFTILRNGREMTKAERDAINTWMETPGAIAALAGLLAQRNLTGFDMYVPLGTAGKAAMAEQSISDVEEMLRDIMEDESRGLVFTKRHIEMAIEHNYSGQGSYWRGEFQGLWSQYCVGLKGPTGGPRRARIFGTQKKLFCFRANLRSVRSMPEAAVQRQLARWGGGDPLQSLAETKGLIEKDE